MTVTAIQTVGECGELEGLEVVPAPFGLRQRISKEDVPLHGAGVLKVRCSEVQNIKIVIDSSGGVKVLVTTGLDRSTTR
jgi:hypothetical protein